MIQRVSRTITGRPTNAMGFSGDAKRMATIRYWKDPSTLYFYDVLK